MSQLIFNKQTSAPATPSADKIAVFMNANEVLAFVNDLGVVNIPALVTSGTFTPSLTFGGGATGMTFTSRLGRWRRFENMIRVAGFITLSAKGSSTGAAVITSLPVAGEATAFNFQPATVRLNTMASISGHVQGFLSPSATTIELEHLGTGTAAALTEANFNNTSSIVFSIWYEV